MKLKAHRGKYPLDMTESFKHLGLIFHESGSMTPALERLLQNGNGARSCLAAKYKQLHCNKSFPMMMRLFDAICQAHWSVSYGCEIWGTLCSGAALPEMGALQLAFFCQLCKHRKRVSASVIFAELAEVPWLRVWWTQVLSFMHRLAKMSEDSLHADILRDNIHDAEHSPLVANWAGGICKQFADLGMATPFPAWRCRRDGRRPSFSKGNAVPGGVCLAGLAHAAPGCAFASCQAVHLFPLVCSA